MARSKAPAAVALLLVAVAEMGLPGCCRVWCWAPMPHRTHSHRLVKPSARYLPMSPSGVPELVTTGIEEASGTVERDNDKEKDGGGKDEEEEEALWQDEQGNGAQLCRICTSPDGEIPLSVVPPHILNSKIRRRLDAFYHAASHQETSSLKYMKSEKQSSRRKLQDVSSGLELSSQDVSAGLSDLEEQFDEEEERRLVSMIRTSLEDAGFELLDRRDLDLCEALNAGYLLRLSIQPDLNECDPTIAEQFYPERFSATAANENGDGSERGLSSTLGDKFLFGGRVLVFRRGYSEEVTIGRLLLPKLDYLQASIVQRSARIVIGRLARLERWVVRKFSEISGAVLAKTTDLVGKMPLPAFVKSNMWNATETCAIIDETDRSDDRNETKILKFTRYGGSREQFVAGPDLSETLNPFLVCDVNYSTNSSMCAAINTREVTCEYDANYPQKGGDRETPMRLLRRVSISNLVNFFSPQGRREIVRGYFKKAKLVEPTYEEVVVIWRPLPKKRPKVIKEVEPPKALIEVAQIFGVEDRLPEKMMKKRKTRKKANNLPSLKIRAFTDVPMANLPAVLPKTRLVFRQADALVFDTVSLFSLAAVLASQRFDNPKFDLLAIVAISLWIIRTTFRYSNKLARYDLLVNKFLKERISHRGANALKYLSSEAATQKATRATLLYSTLQRWFSGKADGDVIRMGDTLEWAANDVNEALFTDRPINIAAGTALADLESLGAVRSVDGIIEEIMNEDDFSEEVELRWKDILP